MGANNIDIIRRPWAFSCCCWCC